MVEEAFSTRMDVMTYFLRVHLFFFFFLFWLSPVIWNSLVRGHKYSNSGSLTHCARPGSNLHPSAPKTLPIHCATKGTPMTYLLDIS